MNEGAKNMSNQQQQPSIGRVVHYTNLGDRDGKYPPTVQAALITGLNDDGTVTLHVFYKTGQFDIPTVIVHRGRSRNRRSARQVVVAEAGSMIAAMLAAALLWLALKGEK